LPRQKLASGGKQYTAGIRYGAGDSHHESYGVYRSIVGAEDHLANDPALGGMPTLSVGLFQIIGSMQGFNTIPIF